MFAVGLIYIVEYHCVKLCRSYITNKFDYTLIDCYCLCFFQRSERTPMAEFILYITLHGQHSGRIHEHRG